jgi:cell division septum initiation protein DivIVA
VENPIKKKVAEVAATKIRKTATEKAQRMEQEASQKADEIMNRVTK